MNNSIEHNLSDVTSPCLKEIIQRGYAHQATNLAELDKALNNSCISFYTGFDCTAKSLHVGSLMQIMLMRLLQKYGHKPIVIMGGATTRIGDPSDKEEMRKMLSLEAIEENKKSISKIFHKILNFSDSANHAIILDNSEWLENLSYLEILSKCGRHVSVNRMLSFDSVRLRLERQQPLSFLEFNYMILQAYDFVELYKTHGCTLQLGGSEQWGNIVSGIDLGRKLEGADLFGLTTKLITKADGKKMGKTASGAIWLNDDMLPSYDFWNFWRNVDDADVIRFLKIYTDIPLSQIDELSNLKGNDINEAKILLANSVTALCHGDEAAQQARESARNIFEDGGNAQNFSKQITITDLSEHLYETLVRVGFATSNNAAKKLILGEGVRMDDTKITDQNITLRDSFTAIGISIKDNNTLVARDQQIKDYVKLSAGKKKHVILKLAAS